LEREVVTLKKVLCLFLGIVFVCCVLCHGENKRFSVQVMIDNLLNFEDMPTIEDVTDCWTLPYRIYNVEGLNEWVEWYGMEETDEGGMAFVYKGRYPLAYEDDGSLTTHYAYEWVDVYTKGGTWNKNPKGDPFGGYAYPIVTQYNEKVYYSSYDGDNLVLAFFDDLVAFYLRLDDTVKIVAKGFVSVFSNMRYLLPWNNVVEV